MENQTGSGSSTEDARAALDSVDSWCRLLIGLATGSIVLSATVIEKLYVGHGFGFLATALTLFAVSIGAGLLVILQRISQLAESDLTIRGGALEYFSLAQSLTFTAAVVCFLVFALVNVRHRGTPAVLDAQSTPGVTASATAGLDRTATPKATVPADTETPSRP